MSSIDSGNSFKKSSSSDSKHSKRLVALRSDSFYFESPKDTPEPASLQHNNHGNDEFSYSVFVDDRRLSQLIQQANSSFSDMSDSSDQSISKSIISSSSSERHANTDNIRGSPNPSQKGKKPVLLTSQDNLLSSQHELKGHSSMNTVATSVLILSGNNQSSNDALKLKRESVASTGGTSGNRTSSFYSAFESPINSNNSALEKICHSGAVLDDKEHVPMDNSEIGSHSFMYEDTIEPTIEEAYKLLKIEADMPMCNLSLIRSKEFEPTKFQLSMKSLKATDNAKHISALSQNTTSYATQSTNKSSKPSRITHNSSLLENILVTSPTSDKTDNTRNISLLKTISSPRKLRQSTNEMHITHTPKITRSQLDLMISNINSGSYNANPTNSDSPDIIDLPNDLEKGNIPIQHIDSNSVHSYDSEKYKFTDVFSIWSIIKIITIGLIVPPVFLMIAAGSKCGFSDYRILKLILNQEHRIGLLRGFVWDVDIHWFRMLCFCIGSIEFIAILACIGVGGGVGLATE
ncbi:hypothetical protein KAFR_0F03910 [Kazachstania africana CBS 2517]|uniref:Uncharacterized protein n=1 Tax=Kazachstania africana (strain ATCC 22294 / BCRC 22015 / CBS 2517 / CECT 1963 / NBRC 1671 / NRRL Y-8276) TaxID=1071382 RepID=H2AX87_KAZAF|nr:hypothetical protein KAFR_0F03910 [Kazachstania africana CBS 2517]CCF58987.1 hypothetical protein KAFR_0F03910 [Kazachstania africana CBS 2517]